MQRNLFPAMDATDETLPPVHHHKPMDPPLESFHKLIRSHSTGQDEGDDGYGAGRATTGEVMPRAGQRGPDVGGGIAATDATGYSAPLFVSTKHAGATPQDDTGRRNVGNDVQID